MVVPADLQMSRAAVRQRIRCIGMDRKIARQVRERELRIARRLPLEARNGTVVERGVKVRTQRQRLSVRLNGCVKVGRLALLSREAGEEV